MNVIGWILIVEGFIAFICAKGYLLLPNYKNEVQFLTTLKKLGIWLVCIGILLILLKGLKVI